MEKNVLGLHHITAIASDARTTLDFYTRVLGLRLVKKTVNFDDPGTYHFYFGDETGSPGTILTFFPWVGIGAGRNGPGMATRIGFSVPGGSLEFWKKRLADMGVAATEPDKRWGESRLDFRDPDGLVLSLVVPHTPDTRSPWTGAGVEAASAIRGFHGVELTLRRLEGTAAILTGVLGYELRDVQGDHNRFVNDALPEAGVVDVTLAPGERPGVNAAGTNHHVAFRVKDEKAQDMVREQVVAKGLSPTSRIDRDYFYSVYFREPGGVLFEVATENPGFTVDEPLAELGRSLKLPRQYESARADIEKLLPAL